MFDKVNPRPNFPELEKKTIDFWKDKKIFERQVEEKDPDNQFVFYDGPPFITGLPHYGHLLGSIAKDIIPRYHAMLGKRVERVWGWDCHGLPIESKVEKVLNVKNKEEIEELGIDKFIEECYKYTREVSAEWNWYIDRIGRWADMDRAYRTMDQNYMESVMWVIKQLYDKNLVYEGIRTSMFDTASGTPVSNFEVAMDDSYEEILDPTVTVKFELHDQEGDIPTYMLAWTTTPWTLPSNRALVVDKDGKYLKVKRKVEVNPDHKGATAFIYDPKKDRFLILNWERDKALGIKSLVQGSQEEGETLEETILREVTEETGYKNIKIHSKLGKNTYEAIGKNKGIVKNYDIYLVELENGEQQKQQLEPGEVFEIGWVGKNEIVQTMTHKSLIEFAKLALKALNGENFEELEFNEGVPKPESYEEYLILGKERADEVLEDTEYEVIEEINGEDLVGLSYKPLFDFIPGNENDFKVYHFDNMVNADEGVGIVHSAPGFGEIDSEMGKHHDLTPMFNIDDDGNFVPEITTYAGMFYSDANKHIVSDLKSRDLLLKTETILHRMPISPRWGVPLIYKAQKSWFLDVANIKDQLLENNEKINWMPAHLKDGRFKKGIESAPDWCISRSRYWGTPLPVWQAEDENGQVIERVVIGSRDELMERNDEITKLVLVRHGDYDKSGEIDGELSKKGVDQAHNLVTVLENTNPDAFLTSSMKNAAQTAEIIKLGLDFKVDERFGSASRKEELYARKEKAGYDLLIDMEEADIRELVSDQIKKDTESLKKLNEEYKGKTVMACTHAEVIASFRHILEGGNIKGYLKSVIDQGDTFTLYLYKGKLLDLHRPVIDNIVLKGDKVDKLHRVPETLDVWMESASMPYAQKHYPFENKEDVEENFPADYIAEYIAQTRAWFYVMHVVSTALKDSHSFKNVVTTGVIMGNDGRKMSKSFGNYPDPKGVMEEYGGDAVRMYLMDTPLLKGENANIDEKAIKSKLREFSLPLWNSYSFLVTYSHIHNWEPDASFNPGNVTDHLDKWAISRYKSLVESVRSKLDGYDIPAATRELMDFLNDLSKWFIRRSRDRFKEGDIDALNTLYYVLFEFIKVCAPFTPFISEEIYQNLNKSNTESIHLEDYPVVTGEIDTELLEKMSIVRQISSLGQSLRVENGIKLRQPLSKLEIINKSESKFDDWMMEVLQDELNVKEVQLVDNFDPKKQMLVLKEGMRNVQIGIDSELTDELFAEGMVREIVRNIQATRKKQGLKFGEMVDILIWSSDSKINAIIEDKKDEIMKETNSSDIKIEENNGKSAKLGSESELKIEISNT